MKRKTLVQASSILVFIVLTISNLSAQVTIGSTQTPITGALLDLKESGTTTKGLGLPRVSLTKLKPTTPAELSASIGGTGNWDMDDHIGLVVYNIPDDLYCPTVEGGIYVWGGDEWHSLNGSASLTGLSTPGKANTYIMKPFSCMLIPVEQGFDVWNTYKSAGVTPTTAEIEAGKVLDISSVNNLTGTLSASIVWQETHDDDIDFLSDVFIDNPDALASAKLVVKTKGKYGNALVAVHLGATGTNSDPVLWQWQIWIPEGDISSAVVTDGTYSWDFMDRYLGAVNNTPVTYNASDPTTRNAHGTFYQWGRPTPFKKFADLIPSYSFVSNDERGNFTKAIQTEVFTFNNVPPADWYSDNAINKWTTRWGDGTTNETGSKTLLDPCPTGWRVPAYKGGVSPWFKTVVSGTTGDGTGTLNQGWVFNNNYGYYAAAGYRNFPDSNLAHIGISGIIWAASPTSNGGHEFEFAASPAGYVDPTTSFFSYPSSGFQVRCVRD